MTRRPIGLSVPYRKQQSISVKNMTEDEKNAFQEARNALMALTGGTQCTPMEKEFFIRGYLLGKDSKRLLSVLNPIAKTDNSTIDLFGQ